MQREEVEHLRTNLLRLAQDCAEEPGWESDAPMLRFAANILCALRDALDRAEAERDAAYAAGYAAALEDAAALFDCLCMDGRGDDMRRHADAIRALPIRDRPE